MFCVVLGSAAVTALCPLRGVPPAKHPFIPEHLRPALRPHGQVRERFEDPSCQRIAMLRREGGEGGITCSVIRPHIPGWGKASHTRFPLLHRSPLGLQMVSQDLFDSVHPTRLGWYMVVRGSGRRCPRTDPTRNDPPPVHCTGGIATILAMWASGENLIGPCVKQRASEWTREREHY